MNTQTETTAEAGDQSTPSNTGLTRAKFEKELASFGRAFAKGQNSRPAMALRAVEAASKLSDVGPDDAADLYSKFQKAIADVQGDAPIAEQSIINAGSHKAQVSKLRQFLIMGALPSIDSVDVMNRATDIIKELAGLSESPIRGSTYDNMVSVARAQIKQPEEALSDDAIRSLLSKVPEEKTELDKLIDMYKKGRKLMETLTGDHMAAAVDELAQAIEELGGEVPAEKETVKAKNKLASLMRQSAKLKAEQAALEAQLAAAQ